jgi:predicted transcriptional regulator
MEKKSIQMRIRIDQSTKDSLKFLAEQRNQTSSEVVRTLIRQSAARSKKES